MNLMRNKKMVRFYNNNFENLAIFIIKKKENENETNHKSHSFARIAGLKTLSPEVIEEIKKMGYKLTEEKKEI
jgi:hypothetical protein